MRVHPSDAEVREVGPSTVEATLTISARDIGLALTSFALWSLEHGKVTPDAVAVARIAQGNQVGWSQEKK